MQCVYLSIAIRKCCIIWPILSYIRLIAIKGYLLISSRALHIMDLCLIDIDSVQNGDPLFVLRDRLGIALPLHAAVASVLLP